MHCIGRGTAVPVVDLLVVDPATNKILKPNEVGELWMYVLPFNIAETVVDKLVT